MFATDRFAGTARTSRASTASFGDFLRVGVTKVEFRCKRLAQRRQMFSSMSVVQSRRWMGHRAGDGKWFFEGVIAKRPDVGHNLMETCEILAPIRREVPMGASFCVIFESE